MIEWSYAMDVLNQQAAQPIYTLVGTDAYLAGRFIQSAAVAFGAGTEVHRFWLDEAGLESALLDLQTLSLFGDTSLTILENATALSTEGKSKVDLSPLEAYAANPTPDRTLVIVVPAEKLDERRKIAKLLKKYPVINCGVPADAAAKALLSQLAKEVGIETSDGALTELWRRAQSITAAVNELHKAKSYLNEDEPLTVEVVQELVIAAPEDNVFTWVDGVVHGRLQESVEALSDLQHAGYDTFALLAMLQRQLRLLWYAKVYGSTGASPQDIARLAGAHPYAVKVAMGQARGLTDRRIESLLVTIADAEYDTKRGKMDAGHALMWVLLACSETKRKGQRAI